MRKLLRFLGGVLGVMLLFVALLPWLAYERGLSRFDRLPAPPAQLATAEQQAWVWKLARGTGMPKVAPMNPYRALNNLFFTTRSSPPAGEMVAYWVAREHAMKQPVQNMASWHLSTGALAIWFTRHWSSEELASAAYAITIKWPPPRKPRAFNPEP